MAIPEKIKLLRLVRVSGYSKDRRYFWSYGSCPREPSGPSLCAKSKLGRSDLNWEVRKWALTPFLKKSPIIEHTIPSQEFCHPTIVINSLREPIKFVKIGIISLRINKVPPPEIYTFRAYWTQVNILAPYTSTMTHFSKENHQLVKKVVSGWISWR